MRIEDEIKQKKFSNEYHKLDINMMFTASYLGTLKLKLLKPYKISWQQFNILRILRGRHPEPATVKLLTERMIDKMSNASRLVEKLKQKGLVERHSCQEDRRQVDIRITEKGLELIERASREMERHLWESYRNISAEEAQILNNLLDKLRG